MTNTNVYISTIPFSGLLNWSVQYLNETKISFNAAYPMVRIGKFLTRNKTAIKILNDHSYKRATIKVRNGGVFLRDIEKGANIGTKNQFVISDGQFLLSKIDARNGAFGVVPAELDGAIITGNFWTFDVDYQKVNPYYLSLVVTTPEFVEFCEQASNGTTNRHYLQEPLFLDIKIPLPSLAEQNKLVDAYNAQMMLATEQETIAVSLQSDIENFVQSTLGLSKPKANKHKGLQTISFKDIQEWGIDKIINSSTFSSKLFNTTSLENTPDLVIEVFRGKSPKYVTNSPVSILNQKCIRWNSIELEWAKPVDEKWINDIGTKFLTHIGDILVNSTGEGTIGRSSIVTNEHTGLLYDSHVLLLRLDSNKLNPNYYVEVFNSEYGQYQVNSVKSAQSTKQTELGINNLLKIKIPLPPIEVQNEIVDHINSLKEQIKTLRTQASENKAIALKSFEQNIFQ